MVPPGRSLSAAYIAAVAQDAFEEGDEATAFSLIELAYQALEDDILSSFGEDEE